MLFSGCEEIIISNADTGSNLNLGTYTIVDDKICNNRPVYKNDKMYLYYTIEGGWTVARFNDINNLGCGSKGKFFSSSNEECAEDAEDWQEFYDDQYNPSSGLTVECGK